MGCSSSKIPEVEEGGEHSFEERNEKEEHNQVIDSTVLDKSKDSALSVENDDNSGVVANDAPDNRSEEPARQQLTAVSSSQNNDVLRQHDTKRLPLNDSTAFPSIVAFSSIIDYPVSFVESFDKEYFDLDVESKEVVIEGLVGKLQSLVSVYDEIDDLQLCLLQLLSVITNEDSPIVLSFFMDITIQKNVINSLFRYLYRYRDYDTFIISITRYLLFFYINIPQKLMNDFESIYVTILISMLDHCLTREEVVCISLCDVLSLIDVLSSNPSFCEQFVKCGGLSSLHSFFDFVQGNNLIDLLNPLCFYTEDNNEQISQEFFSLTSNIVYYLFHILYLISSHNDDLEQLTTFPFVTQCNEIELSIISIMNAVGQFDSHRSVSLELHPDFSVWAYSCLVIRYQEKKNPDERFVNCRTLIDRSMENIIVSLNKQLLTILEVYTRFLNKVLCTKSNQLSFVKNNGINVLWNLISFPSNLTESSLFLDIMTITENLIKSNLISNTVLSMNGIEKLLLQLLYIVSNSEIMNGLSEINQQSASLSVLQLISYQLSHSSTSKELIDAPSFVSKLYCYIEFDDRTVFFPVIIDCILSLTDMNEKNLEAIAQSKMIEDVYPLFSLYLEDETMVVKITMIIAIFSNYYGFDSFFQNGDVMNCIRDIALKYHDNVVIMQNCLVAMYYLSQFDNIMANMDKQLFDQLSLFVATNQHDQAVLQRFSRIKERLEMSTVL